MMSTALQMPTISVALQWAAKQITSVSDVASLDAEILLAHVLSATRSHLHAWPDRLLTPEQRTEFVKFVSRRLHGEPVAYVTGRKEFWSLDLVVTPDTLIPRPETELLVELLLAKFPNDEIKIVADLGTGSGAVALAIAHERPSWIVHATDIMPAALHVAMRNAERLGILNVKFASGSWCSALPHTHFDAIISNPPYVALGDPNLEHGVLKSEPSSALISGTDGLYDIRQIIQQAKKYLKLGGFIMVEHGSGQAEAVSQLFEKERYHNILLHQDLAGLDRVTIANTPVTN